MAKLTHRQNRRNHPFHHRKLIVSPSHGAGAVAFYYHAAVPASGIVPPNLGEHHALRFRF
jgi:hypothetical protein